MKDTEERKKDQNKESLKQTNRKKAIHRIGFLVRTQIREMKIMVLSRCAHHTHTHRHLFVF